MFHIALLLIGCPRIEVLVAKGAARRVSIGRITDDVLYRRQANA